MTTSATGVSCDVETLIIGAGPAGMAAGIELARADRSVLVLDKATFPRDKICGDGLTAGCLRQLEALGFDPTSVPSWRNVDEVVLHTPGRAALEYQLPAGKGIYAASATRVDLDLGLVELATASGVAVASGEAAETVRVHGDFVSVQTTTRTIRSRYLIAADGMWSKVRRQLGLGVPGYRGEWHAFRQYFSGVSRRAANELHVWFEPEILPGYLWSFPLADDEANIGFGVWRSGFPLNTMRAMWSELLERPHVREIIGTDATPIAPVRAWPIPARLGDLPLTGHRTLFVGDAAAACDPMTGEGIGQALETGREAASAIVAASGGDPSRVTDHYQHRIEQGLARDMRLALRLGAVLGERRWAELALRTTALTPWTRRNFIRWLFEDYPRAVLGTPRRWSASMFTQPGAFQNTNPSTDESTRPAPALGAC